MFLALKHFVPTTILHEYLIFNRSFITEIPASVMVLMKTSAA